MTTTSPEIAADRRRHPRAAAVRALLALAARRRLDRIAAGDGLRAARARQGGRRSVNADPAPPPLMAFPGVPDIGSRRRSTATSTPRSSWSAATSTRTGVSGLDRFFVINIDHHPGNTGYGQINWFDAERRRLRRDGLRPGRARSACRCRSRSRRTSTSRSSPTPDRSTTRASRRGRSTSAASALEAGVDPVLVARNVYDSNNMGRLKLFGAVLSAMQIDPTGRIAIVYLDHEMARAAGGTYEDTEGLINLPLTVKEIQAVVFFKQDEGRRVPRQPAVEGRHRHRRRRQGVRRRRPQERGRLHGQRRRSTRCRRCSSRRSSSAIDGRPARR